MSLIYQNPHLEENHNLIRQFEQTKDNSLLPKIEDADKRAKEYLQQKIGNIQKKIETIREEKEVDKNLKGNVCNKHYVEDLNGRIIN